jgi:hypothetical protein
MSPDEPLRITTEAELAHARELRRDKIVLAVFVVVAIVAIGLWRLSGG